MKFCPFCNDQCVLERDQEAALKKGSTKFDKCILEKDGQCAIDALVNIKIDKQAGGLITTILKMFGFE